MIARERHGAARINSAALAVLPALLRQWLPNGEQRGDMYVALNPRRDDRSLGSFQINTRNCRWQDHAIGASGRDLISLVAYLHANGDYRKAVALLADEPIVRSAIATGATAVAAKPAKAASSSAKVAFARRIYRTSNDIQNTAAEAYLRSRGLRRNDAWETLRTSVLGHPEGGRHPALVAPFMTLDGVVSGIHRTYLQPSGAKLSVKSVRLTLGQVRGCAIRLGEPDEQLIICEGLEDGLTLFQELDGLPVWVAGGAGLMSSIQLPDHVRLLTIAADNDEAGELGARIAAERHCLGDRETRIMRPSSAFKDFNDQLRGTKRGS